jgi:hypothetical protein
LLTQGFPLSDQPILTLVQRSQRDTEPIGVIVLHSNSKIAVSDAAKGIFEIKSPKRTYVLQVVIAYELVCLRHSQFHRHTTVRIASSG